MTKPLQEDEREAAAQETTNTPEEAERKLVAEWTRRFDRAKEYRRPYLERDLRMYYLYRAYRKATNYAYKTSVMPPIGFEIVETVKPRLAAAQIKVDVNPKGHENINSPSLSAWDDLIEYNLQQAQFEDKKIQWMNPQLMYGNGYLQAVWGGDFMDFEVVDNFILYIDPLATNRLKDSRYEIKQAWKTKAQIETEEKERGDENLYHRMVDGVEVKLTETECWKEDIKEQSVSNADDPRYDRYRINTMKMSQVDSGVQRADEVDPSQGEQATDKAQYAQLVEIWECYDHLEHKIVTIMNRTKVVRNEDSAYKNVLGGRTIIDLVDHAVNHEHKGIGHLEPVETLIHEIADSRNQAMDGIVFTLDPIRKVAKGKGYKAEDLVHGPGATWFLANVNDVTFERLPDISRQWVDKEQTLRRDIQTALALSEYVSGVPQSSQEPASKVETLLVQTNIRFALILRQFEIAMNDVVTAIIQGNKEFLTIEDEKPLRLLKRNGVTFKTFKQEDLELDIDATVTIVPKREKTPEQESRELMELYKMFIVDEEKPQPGTREYAIYTKKKVMLQRQLVRSLGYEDMLEVLVPEEEVTIQEPANQQPQGPEPVPQDQSQETLVAENPIPQMLAENVRPEPILDPQQALLPPQAGQQQGGGLAGLLQRLAGRGR